MQEINTAQNIQPDQLPQSPKRNWWKTGFFLLLFATIVIIGLLRSGFFAANINQVTPTLIPTTQVQATPTMAETADWKTYTNSEYNFAFQYPSIMSLDDEKGIATVRVGKPLLIGGCSEFVFSVEYKNPRGIPQPTGNLQLMPPQFDIYSFNIGGKNASRVDTTSNLEGFSCVLSTIYIPDVVDPEMNIYMRRQKDKYPDLFDQILSTFKFLD